MFRKCKWPVCVVLAGVPLAVLTTSANSTPDRSNGGGIHELVLPRPGATVGYKYQASGTDVAVLQTSVRLPPQMHLVKDGSSKYSLVNGKPTWFLRNLYDPFPKTMKSFVFRARILSTVKVGSKLPIWFYQTSVNSEGERFVQKPWRHTTIVVR